MLIKKAGILFLSLSFFSPLFAMNNSGGYAKNKNQSEQLLKRLTQQLLLNSLQQAKIRQLLSDYKSKSIANKMNRQHLLRKLKNMAQSTDNSDASIDEVTQQLGKLYGEKFKLKFTLKKQIFSVLNEEQQTKAKELFKKKADRRQQKFGRQQRKNYQRNGQMPPNQQQGNYQGQPFPPANQIKNNQSQGRQFPPANQNQHNQAQGRQFPPPQNQNGSFQGRQFPPPNQYQGNNQEPQQQPQNEVEDFGSFF